MPKGSISPPPAEQPQPGRVGERAGSRRIKEQAGSSPLVDSPQPKSAATGPDSMKNAAYEYACGLLRVKRQDGETLGRVVTRYLRDNHEIDLKKFKLVLSLQTRV
jgi:hypothetical protein